MVSKISDRSSIPHVIHYCWFGHKELSPIAQRSLRSWHRFVPDFEIRRWDESNAPLEDCSFIHDAYLAGKWAFVSDYVRFWALYQYGGIYMDVGSELVKDITPLIRKAPFSAIEAVSLTATPGLIICCLPQDPVVHEALRVYTDLPFINTRDYLMAHTVNEVFTSVLERYGYHRQDNCQKIAGWTILSSDYFDPFYGFGGYHLTKHTYSIHHSSASWLDPVQQTKRKIQMRVTPFIGHRLGEITGRVVGELAHNGLQGVRNLYDVSLEVIRRRRDLK